MEQLFLTDKQRVLKQSNHEKNMKINDVIAMILGLLGLMLAIWEYERFMGKLDWDETQDPWTYEVEREQYQEEALNTGLRVIIGLSSVVLGVLVYNHYRIVLELYKTKQKVDSYDTLKSAGLLKPMIIEVIYCLIHTPPGVNTVYTLTQHDGDVEYPLSTFIVILMLGRIYLIWRIFADYSSWNDERAEEICNSCLCDGGVNFAIKAELKESPYRIVFCVMFISIFIFGVALRTAERPFKGTSGQDWDYLWNGMWCIIITMTTVGFGDFYPTTHLGRVVGVVACFWGTFLVSIMVVALTLSTSFTPQQRQAYERIKRDEDERKLRVKASNAIKNSIGVRLFLKKNPYASERKKAIYMNKFKNAIIAYRNHKRMITSSEQDAPMDQVLGRLNDRVSFGLDNILNDCKVYKSLLVRLDNAEVNQKKLSEESQSIREKYKQVIEKITAIKSNRGIK